MAVVKWERVEPVEPCVSPDGHNYQDVVILSSPVPVAVVCTRCGCDWTVVVFDDGA